MKGEWPCEYCTFLNDRKDKVCAVCCKTRSSALPPPKCEDEEDAEDLESSLAKLRLAEPETASLKAKGRAGRKISFSFGTKFRK